MKLDAGFDRFLTQIGFLDGCPIEAFPIMGRETFCVQCFDIFNLAVVFH